MAPIVEIEHLTKKFDARVVVDDVSFVVQAGTILGLLGPNGAGKSTVINMIVGLLRKTSGKVRLFGQVAEGNRELRKKIGMIP